VKEYKRKDAERRLRNCYKKPYQDLLRKTKILSKGAAGIFVADRNTLLLQKKA
tara:strand:+ start:1741 stop:1899 length:159 start_codon:yes stop_codon:yes gene_type:complete